MNTTEKCSFSFKKISFQLFLELFKRFLRRNIVFIAATALPLAINHDLHYIGDELKGKIPGKNISAAGGNEFYFARMIMPSDAPLL